LQVSGDVSSGHIGIERQVAYNCDWKNPQQLKVEIYDKSSHGSIAETITLQLVEVEKAYFPKNVKRNIQERLQDSGLPLDVGHRFTSVMANGKVFTLEVVMAKPRGPGVICTENTKVEIDNLTAIDVSSNDKISFADVGGLVRIKRRLIELVILPTYYPEVFRKLGIEPAKGILLNGPPGSGKTLLARAVASKFDASFFPISGPELFSKWYGESEARLRKVFQQAYQAAPSVVFIDELDAIASPRELASGDLETRMVSQLLTLMDGINERGQIVVIGATNRIAAIDSALRRPGRFDTELEVLPPDVQEREEILEIHTRSMTLSPDVNLEEVAKKTVGYVGADLALLCQEAALSAIRRSFDISLDGEIVENREVSEITRVTSEDFTEALRILQPSAFRTVEQPKTMIGWDEAIDFGNVKKRLVELFDWPLTHESVFQQFGMQPKHCILLTGLPRSGKTSMVLALVEQLNRSLIYVRSENLLMDDIGKPELVVRDTFRRAKLAEPSILVLDNFEQILSVHESRLALRILNQIQSELNTLQGIAHISVVIVTRSDPGHLSFLEQHPVFDYLFSLPTLTKKEIRGAILKKLGNHLLERSPAFDAFLNELDNHVDTIGDVLQMCERAVFAALRETPTVQKIEVRHLRLAFEELLGNSGGNK
jgi:transitional endoplasmic reticulum ATPase